MKVITLWQPWATLLAAGKKKCETRSWKTNYRGEILIHAGKKNVLYGARLMPSGAWGKAKASLIEFANRGDLFPTGAIIGKADLVNCILIDEQMSALIKEQNPDEYIFGDFTPGRYAWVMENAVLFEEPIPASGKQGLWTWEGGIKE